MRRAIAGYEYALIYSYVVRRPDSNRTHRKMQRLLAGLERTMFLDGCYKAFGLCAGPCRLCSDCDPTGRCRFPYLARPAMEACGIDVYGTCRNAGIELKVVTRPGAPSKHINLILIG
jgi:predicted metal-binding protein